jgi:hypothetical protein
VNQCTFKLTGTTAKGINISKNVTLPIKDLASGTYKLEVFDPVINCKVISDNFVVTNIQCSGTMASFFNRKIAYNSVLADDKCSNQETMLLLTTSNASSQQYPLKIQVFSGNGNELIGLSKIVSTWQELQEFQGGLRLGPIFNNYDTLSRPLALEALGSNHS